MARTAILDTKNWDKYLKFIDEFAESKKSLNDIAKLIASDTFNDIMDHFQKQEGHDGRWKDWSPITKKFFAKYRPNRLSGFILQDKGRLRQGTTPAKYRVGKGLIVWFNSVKYAHRHDEGTAGMPQRSFMWLSGKAMDSIAVKVLSIALEGKR